MSKFCLYFNMSSCAQTPLASFLNEVTKKIRKGKHKKIFCDPSKIFKNISWLINICLKYFMASTKTFCPLLYT